MKKAAQNVAPEEAVAAKAVPLTLELSDQPVSPKA
jgi:hypothetical protein